MEGNIRDDLLQSIMTNDFSRAKELRDQFEAEQRSERLTEARRLIEKHFDPQEFLGNVDADQFKRAYWGKIKNHETISHLDRLKYATIQAFESDLKRINDLLGGAIETLIDGGEA